MKPADALDMFLSALGAAVVVTASAFGLALSVVVLYVVLAELLGPVLRWLDRRREEL